MEQKQIKNAAIVAVAMVFILLVFVLGMKLVGGSAAATPPALIPSKADDGALPTNSSQVEVPAADAAKTLADAPPPLVNDLMACQSHLQAASDSLHAATGNNKGGYDVKARVDAAKALGDIAGAIDFARAHPEIAQLPAPETQLDIAQYVQVGHDHPNAAPKLSHALDVLSTALDQLHQTPGGDIGGFREKLLGDIALTASDTATGISIAADGGRVPRPQGIPRGPPPIIPSPAVPPVQGGALPDKALEFATNVDMVRTTTSHLQAAQTYMMRVVAALDATPNGLSGGFDAKAKTDANQTLDDIKAALAYVHDHPEIDALNPNQTSLPPPGDPHLVPAYARWAFNSPTQEVSATVGTVSDKGVSTGKKEVAYGPMDAHGIRIDQDGKGVSVYLGGAMQNLVNARGLFFGTRGSSGSGIGDMGGFRSKIFDDLSKTSEDSLAGLDFIHEHTTGTPVKPTIPGPGVRATAATATSQPGLP